MITDSDIVAHFDNPAGDAYPMAINQDGSVIAYAITSQADGVGEHIMLYKNGHTYTVPALNLTSAQSASLTADGSTLVYTLWLNDLSLYGGDTHAYPGVYAWQTP